jgi:hypothetical protein
MALETNDQIDRFDKLLEALNERDAGMDLSTLNFIAAMHDAGLKLVPGDQTDTLRILAKPEWSE